MTPELPVKLVDERRETAKKLFGKLGITHEKPIPSS